MNINIKLSNELQERIEEEANKQLEPVIEQVLNSDTELEKLLRETIRGQVKSIALRVLQSPDMRSRMAQLVYPIIYETFGLLTEKEAERIKDFHTNNVELVNLSEIEKELGIK